MQEKMIKNFAKVLTDWNHKQDFFLKILQESLHKFTKQTIILKVCKIIHRLIQETIIKNSAKLYTQIDTSNNYKKSLQICS
jgi:hypothetical protein